MTEQQILQGIKKYFKIYELVGKRTYDQYGERAWRFFDFRLLETLLILRESINKPITANTWKHGGKFTQRGLRTTAQTMIQEACRKDKLYLTAHILGKAVDFGVEGMTSKQVRSWIKTNGALFPYKIRLEGKVTWVHMDVIYEEHNPKVYTFDP